MIGISHFYSFFQHTVQNWQNEEAMNEKSQDYCSKICSQPLEGFFKTFHAQYLFSNQKAYTHGCKVDDKLSDHLQDICFYKAGKIILMISLCASIYHHYLCEGYEEVQDRFGSLPDSSNGDAKDD